MAGRSLLGCVAVLEQVLHGWAVGLEHTEVARLGPRRLGKPPDSVDGVLDAHPANRDPFSWRREFRRVGAVRKAFVGFQKHLYE